MESRTFELLEFPKILGVLSGLAVSEPGVSACLKLKPFTSLDSIRLETAFFEQGAAWVGESGFVFPPFPELDGLFAYLENPKSVLDQDDLFALKQVP